MRIHLREITYPIWKKILPTLVGSQWNLLVPRRVFQSIVLLQWMTHARRLKPEQGVNLMQHREKQWDVKVCFSIKRSCIHFPFFASILISFCGFKLTLRWNSDHTSPVFQAPQQRPLVAQILRLCHTTFGSLHDLEQRETNPYLYHPWDWYIYLMVDFYGMYVGKYTIHGSYGL